MENDSKFLGLIKLSRESHRPRRHWKGLATKKAHYNDVNRRKWSKAEKGRIKVTFCKETSHLPALWVQRRPGACPRAMADPHGSHLSRSFPWQNSDSHRGSAPGPEAPSFTRRKGRSWRIRTNCGKRAPLASDWFQKEHKLTLASSREEIYEGDFWEVSWLLWQKREKMVFSSIAFNQSRMWCLEPRPSSSHIKNASVSTKPRGRVGR